MPDAVQDALLELARQLGKEYAPPENASSVRALRVEVDVEKLNLLAWLQAQTDEIRTYWGGREEAFAVAGVGAALVEESSEPVGACALFESLKKYLVPKYPGMRFYGGLRFDGKAPIEPYWQAFGCHYFVIPEIEVGRKGFQYFVACNLLCRDGQDFEEARNALVNKIEAAARYAPVDTHHVTTPHTRSDFPDEAGWLTIIQHVLERIDSEELHKVVLARKTYFEFEAPVDPVALLGRLAANTTYSYHFCLQRAHGVAFLGAPPERLYKRVNTYLQSEALAGTRPRGHSPEEDAMLGRELLESDKERREHAFVSQHVRGVFDSFCRAVRGVDHVELLALRHCQHLLSKITGMLESPYSDAGLLEAFHPTPAVGGVPTERALEWIRKLEPFDRGWYAAPVGWVGFDSTEFAVAIRSGLVAGNSLSLYSGAGIVAGSQAGDEWAEIENKMKNFLTSLDAIESLSGP